MELVASQGLSAGISEPAAAAKRGVSFRDCGDGRLNQMESSRRLINHPINLLMDHEEHLSLTLTAYSNCWSNDGIVWMLKNKRISWKMTELFNLYV